MEAATYYRSFPHMGVQGSYTGFLKVKQEPALFLPEDDTDGMYISDVFDSGCSATTWDELHLMFSDTCMLDLYIWCFDDASYRDRFCALPFLDRFYVMSDQGVCMHHKDILLYGHPQTQHGRFLCFAVRVRKQHQKKLYFQGYELSYPAQRFTSYLPAFYQEQGDMEAYFSVFKDLYLHLERQIDQFHEELNLDTCQEEHVQELLEWLGFTTLKDYAEYNVLRRFPAFYQQLKAPRDSLAYIRQLAYFLFQKPMHMVCEQACLDIYVSACDTQTAMHMEAFFQQELPIQVIARLHFIQEIRVGMSCYLDETTLLRTQPCMRLCQYVLSS